MSVLQVYLSWANSVLSEVSRAVDSEVGAIQEGELLCQLIDILAPESDLLHKVQTSVPGEGTGRQRAYIHCALDHMKSHGIKIAFSTQDIMDGDIKSLLDVMWLLILNYGIHFIGDNSFQRTVGVGKKSLLDWCQGELDITFEPKDTLATSLCTDDQFTKLLQVFAGSHIEETDDKVTHLHKLLQEIEERYGVMRSIISPNDLIDGTVDEHTLLIYLSLLKRRVCSTVRSARREMLSVEGKEAALARVEERNRSMSVEVENRRRYTEQAALKHKSAQQQQQQQQQREEQEEEEQHQRPQHQHQHHQHQHQYEPQLEQQHYEQQTRGSRALSLDSSLKAQARDPFRPKSHESLESSTWHSSSDSNSQLSSGLDRRSAGSGGVAEGKSSSLVREAEQVLLQTISEKVQEHVQPASDPDDDKDTDLSRTLSEQSSGAMDEGYGTLRTDTTPQLKMALGGSLKSTATNLCSSMRADTTPRKSEVKAEMEKMEKIKIKISRPKDYFLQWEETLDRLSQGPPSVPDVSDMSPRSPRQILRGIPHPRYSRPRSMGDERDVYRGEPVWKRRENFEKHSPRSTSTPSQSAHATYCVTSSPRDRVSRRIESNRRRAKSSGVVSDRRDRGGRVTDPRDQAENIQFRSSFMNTLEELQRSGKAKKVILPELGPDTPVVMVPAQGKDVLLLFDALKQASGDPVEVSHSGGSANGSTHSANNGSTSPARTSPTQKDGETRVKHAEQSARSSGRQEGEGSTGSLPRPTPHKHRVPKPLDIRVTDLRGGSRTRDGRRTQSATEVKMSSLAASSRYRSLSPLRTSPADHDDSGPHSPADSRAVSPGRDLPEHRDILDRSPGFRPAPSRGSPYLSPYRMADHHPSGSRSLSPYRQASPRHSHGFGLMSERPPPLDLPADMVSPRPRMGGQGRVPRREAWERERKRRGEIQSIDSMGGSSSIGEGGTGLESSAQSRFIQVLYREIADLKQKIEVMEDSQPESSPERHGSMGRGWKTSSKGTSVSAGDDAVFTTHGEIRDSDNRMVLTRRMTGSPKMSSHRSWQSPSHWDAASPSSNRASPGLRTSLSPKRSYTPTARSSTTKAGKELSPRRRSAGDLSSPPRSIQLGYKSPIRSVSQEIWGGNLASDSNADTSSSERREHFRKLIYQSATTDGDVIELKQALASAVVENDILQAKLRNARYDIEEKLHKTNGVLDDCRQHLARSQAENMELRSALERERDRAEKNEVFAQDLRKMVEQVRSDNRELEEELDHTTSQLDQSGPGLEALRQQNDTLRDRAAHIHHQHSSLKREMDDVRKNHSKTLNTVRELRKILDDVRGERDDLQQQLKTLQQQNRQQQQQQQHLQQQLQLQQQQHERQQRQRAAEQANSESRHAGHFHGQEKGAKDETEPENYPVSVSVSGNSGGVGDSFSEKLHSASSSPAAAASATGRRSTSYGGDVAAASSTRSRSAGSTPPCGHSRSVSPPRGLSYRYGTLSPVLPSTYREIYPHRKPRYQNGWDPYDQSPERPDSPQDSPVAFIDYPDLQRFPTKLDPPSFSPARDSPYSPPSRDASPIYKPIPYRPYSSSTSATAEPGARGMSPLSRGRSPKRRSSPGVTLSGLRSASSSPGSLPSERRGRYQDPMSPRSTSCSPVGGAGGRRGILKRGGYGSRERTPSPRYASRSHSPPTRLSPELGAVGQKKKKLSFSPSGVLWGQARSHHGGHGAQLRPKHSSLSWLHLQLSPTDSRTGLPSDVTQPGTISRDEHLLLSDDQRRYANSLIRKYTGIHA